MYAPLLCLLCLLQGPVQVSASSTATPPHATAGQSTSAPALNAALIGKWVGVLEYRDYSEPASSTKRVQLPTWVTITPAPEGVFLDTTYDDGPTKTVFEHEALVVDLQHGTYKSIGTDAVLETYRIDHSTSLQDAHGVLELHGQGTDSGKPADIQITWTIRQNLLSWLEEVRPAGSSEPFVFRHLLTLTRAESPRANGVNPK